MTYLDTCTGIPTEDRANVNGTNGTGFLVQLRTNNAIAQAFVPTSKCLDSITLNCRNLSSDFSADLVIEIVGSDASTGLPTTNPHSGAAIASYTIPQSYLSTTFQDVVAPIRAILPDITPKWIVVTVAPYDPTMFVDIPMYEFSAGAGSHPLERFAEKIQSQEYVLASPESHLVFKTDKLAETSLPPTTALDPLCNALGITDPTTCEYVWPAAIGIASITFAYVLAKNAKMI